MSKRLPQGDGTEPWHGTAGGYTNHHCGCSRCRDAANQYWREHARKLRDQAGRRHNGHQLVPWRKGSDMRRPLQGSGDEPWHGTPYGYSYYLCSCPDCREAFNTYMREYRLRLATDARLARLSPPN